MGKRTINNSTSLVDSKLMNAEAVMPFKKQRLVGDESAALSLLALRKTQTLPNSLTINMFLCPETIGSEGLSSFSTDQANAPVSSITDDEEDTSSRCSDTTTEESPRALSPSIKRIPKVPLRKPKLALLSRAAKPWPALPEGRPLACPPRLLSVTPKKNKEYSSKQ